MKYFINIFILSFLFISIGFLSGYKSESSSSGCSNAPEINILNPKQDDNIENPPVSVEFEAKQNTTDLTSIDLSTLSAIIRDNMNKTIDISQYIASNCDFLKKNCSFKGEVNLEEGEYILQVRICNTTSACETKEVRFILGPPSKDIRDIINRWVSIITRNDFGRWLSFILTCYDKIDNDGDGYTDYDGAGESLLSDYKCKVVNSIGEFKNYSEETEGFIEAKNGGSIALGNMVLDIMPNVLPEDMTIKIKRIPPEGKSLDKLWFDDVYEIVAYKQNGEEFSGDLNDVGIIVKLLYRDLKDEPLDKMDLNIVLYDETWGYISQDSFGNNEYIFTFLNNFSKKRYKADREKKGIGIKTNKSCYDKTEYVLRSGPCYGGGCRYGWFGFPCNTSCIAKKYEGGYDDICCMGCQPVCPIYNCPYVYLELTGRSGECSDEEWGGVEIPCDRWEIIVNKSDCNEMLNYIKNEFKKAGKGKDTVAYSNTKFHIDYDLTAQYIGKEDNLNCYKILITKSSIYKYCDVIYPDWLTEMSNSCKEEWERFIEAIQRHEAGHCNIAMSYYGDIERYLNYLKDNPSEVCAVNSQAAINKFLNDLQNYIDKRLLSIERDNKLYDENTNYGKKQGTIFDCEKCK